MIPKFRPLPSPQIYAGIESLGLPDDVQGWHSTHPIFAKLIDEVKPKVIVEVGSWKGASAIHMANASNNRVSWQDMTSGETVTVNNGPKIYCCDSWLGGIDHDLNFEGTSVIPRDRHGYPRLFHTFLHNVAKAGHQERIVPVVQTSVNGAKLLAAHGIKADLIYIDAGHDELSVLLDLDHYWNLILKPGGIIFGDDFGWDTVATAVGKFATHTGETVEIVDKNFYMFRKPAK